MAFYESLRVEQISGGALNNLVPPYRYSGHRYCRERCERTLDEWGASSLREYVIVHFYFIISANEAIDVLIDRITMAVSGGDDSCSSTVAGAWLQ